MKKSRADRLGILAACSGSVFIPAAVIGLALLCPKPMLGLFGVLDYTIVEPGSGFIASLGAQVATLGHIWEQDISTYAKVAEEVQQMRQIYQTAQDTYSLAYQMARFASSGDKGAWVTVAQAAASDYTRDRFGENSQWSRMLNGNPGMAPGAWTNATVALRTPTFMTGQLPGSAAVSQLATLEAMDGSSTKCLATIAGYRNTAQQNMAAIIALAMSRLDGSAQGNSTAKLLNLLNAGNQQTVNEQVSQGQMNTCLVEQQIIANKVERDRLAEQINFRSAMTDTADEYSAATPDIAGAIQGY